MKTTLCGQIWCVCDALIDQNHYIGNDPIGFRCQNHDDLIEVTVRGIKRDLCKRCFEILQSEPTRISFRS
jgi:hypothetical protein